MTAPSLVPRVLVVDDEPDIREILTLALRDVAGWDVLSAPDGHSGLEAAVEAVPDAIVLDVQMPGLDGVRTALLLDADERTQHIPVLLLTARPESAGALCREAVSVRGVLTKPFDPLTIADELREVLGWPLTTPC